MSPTDIELVVGEPLDKGALRRTLTALHAGGRFAQIEWWIEPLPDGSVRGVLVLQPHRRIRHVRLTGELGLKPRLLLRPLRRLENAVLDPKDVDLAVERLKALYRRYGYFDGSVRTDLQPAGPARRDLIVHLEAGRQALVGEVELAGEPASRLPTEMQVAATAHLKLGPGQPFDGDRFEADRERLRGFFVARGHFEAQIEDGGTRYRAADGEVDLIYRLRLGPLFELGLEGIGRRKLKRKGFLPFLEDRPYDDTLWAQSCARLRQFYQVKGHYTVDVDCRSEGDEERRSLDLRLSLGPKSALRSITLEGAEQIPVRRLEPLLNTNVRRWWSPGSGRLVGPELSADLDRLRSFYLLEGFPEVEVGPARVEALAQADGPTEGELSVRIPIVEGRRQRVVEIHLRSVDGGPLPVPTPNTPLPLRAGGGFHPLLLDDTVNLIRALYEEEGYALAVVTPSLDWNDEQSLVSVYLDIDPGPRRRLDRLILRGLQHTRPELVERFAGLRPGDILSRRRLLKAERDLYRLGIFSEVDVDLAPTASLGSERDVRIRLREGRRWRLAYGVSYHSDDGIGGLFGLSRTHLRGLGERLQLDLRVSENDRRLRLIYDQPSFGRLRLPVTYTLFSRFEQRESFELQENGIRMSLNRDLEGLRLGLVYDYRFVEISEDVPGSLDPSTLEREDTEVEISSLAPNLFIDRRDDPLNPTVGWSTAVQLEYAFPFATAETELVKLFWQQTHYRKLGTWGTLAGSFRLGMIEPLSRPAEPDPFLPAQLPSARVPISERFFAGGRTTHRAYERDRLGVLGQSLIEAPDGRLFETGGNGLMLFNLDYRFPLSGPVEGVVFLDAGNVWSDYQDLDPGDIRPGAGFGVRYASPVGPLRLEIGWKLDPQPWEDSAPVFFLSLGNPF